MASVSLKQIKVPIQSELNQFQVHFKEVMRSKVALLDVIMHYIVRSKGKQMRPMFVFLTAKMFGEVNDDTYTAAALVELLHTATLVHDDVVDEANERRGFFSINALWKNKIAVIVGDYLMAKGLLLALDNDQFQLLKILSGAVRDMSEGELLQLEKARRLDITESVYYDIINGKTASFLAACCRSGTHSTTNDQSTIEKMWEFGQKIGMAFQIKDDLLDFGESETGKPKGGDIKEKKLTLPLIHALSQSSRLEKRKIIRRVKRKKKTPEDIKDIIKFIKSKGGIDYANTKMNEFKEEALKILLSFPKSDARDSLNLLVEYVVDRKK